MGELKSYMIPEMIANKKVGFYGYISLANGTDDERVVNLKWYRPSNGVRYGQKDITIPPRRVISLGHFQTNEYQPDGKSIFAKGCDDTGKCVISVRCDERVITSPYIGSIYADAPSAPCLGNIKECDIWN